MSGCCSTHRCPAATPDSTAGVPGSGPAQGQPVIALAGNPNTGKTTLFNALTGLRQHTGNWPGKTVRRAEGLVTLGPATFRIIDLPGTYSLLAASAEERVARDFLCFARPDAAIVVTDATALERNLSLVLQVTEITPKVVVCLNLMDEARRKGIDIRVAALEERLGVPVRPTSARTGRGVPELMAAAAAVATGRLCPRPLPVDYGPAVEAAVAEVLPRLIPLVGDRVNPRWLALRLVEGDQSALAAVRRHLGDLRLPPAWQQVPLGVLA